MIKQELTRSQNHEELQGSLTESNQNSEPRETMRKNITT